MSVYKLELSEIEVACGVTLAQVQDLITKVLIRNGAVIFPKYTGPALAGATARAALAGPVKFAGLNSLGQPGYRSESEGN